MWPMVNGSKVNIPVPVYQRQNPTSFFLTICFFFHTIDRIFTKLGQNDQCLNGHKSYQQFDLKGHVGVRKVNHVKNMKTAPI